MAGDINLRVQKGFLRLTGDFVYRDLAFILFNVPSFTPFYDFPNGAKTTAEWFVDVGADYYFESWRLNLGAIVGYQHPSTYEGGIPALDSVGSGADVPTYTVVVKRQGNFEILPADQKAFDILVLRGFGRWDMSDGMSAITEVTYTLDKNATRYGVTDDGTFVRQFDRWKVQNRLSLAFILQARF
jgi:hypothetical protein